MHIHVEQTHSVFSCVSAASSNTETINIYLFFFLPTHSNDRMESLGCFQTFNQDFKKYVILKVLAFRDDISLYCVILRGCGNNVSNVLVIYAMCWLISGSEAIAY